MWCLGGIFPSEYANGFDIWALWTEPEDRVYANRTVATDDMGSLPAWSTALCDHVKVLGR